MGSQKSSSRNELENGSTEPTAFGALPQHLHFADDDLFQWDFDVDHFTVVSWLLVKDYEMHVTYYTPSLVIQAFSVSFGGR